MQGYANLADRTFQKKFPKLLQLRFPKLGIADIDDGYVYAAPVGSYEPNGFGLHDMHGNVWQWCEDVYNDSYEGAPADGSAWLTGRSPGVRTLRGGSWINIALYCRSAHRLKRNTAGGLSYSRGFRVVVVSPQDLFAFVYITVLPDPFDRALTFAPQGPEVARVAFAAHTSDPCSRLILSRSLRS